MSEEATRMPQEGRKRGFTLGEAKSSRNKTLSSSSPRLNSIQHTPNSKRKIVRSNAQESSGFPTHVSFPAITPRHERRKAKSKSEGTPKTNSVNKKRSSSKERKKSKVVKRTPNKSASYDKEDPYKRKMKSEVFHLDPNSFDIPLPNALAKHGWLSKPIAVFLETLKSFLENDKSRKIFIDGGGLVLLLFHLRDGDTESQVSILKILYSYINDREVFNALFQNSTAMWNIFNELNVKFRHKSVAKCKLYSIFIKLLQINKNAKDNLSPLIKCFDYYNYKTDEVHRFQHLIQGLKHEASNDVKLTYLQLINAMIGSADLEERQGLRSELTSLGIMEIFDDLNSSELEKEKKHYIYLQRSDKSKFQIQLEIESNSTNSEDPGSVLEILNKSVSKHPRIQDMFYSLASNLLKLNTDDVVGVSQWQIVSQVVAMCADKNFETASNRNQIEKLLRFRMDSEKYLMHTSSERVAKKIQFESSKGETTTSEMESETESEMDPKQTKEKIQNLTMQLQYTEHQLEEVRRELEQSKKDKNELKQQLTRSIQKLCESTDVNQAAQVHFSEMMVAKERTLQETKLHLVLKTKRLQQAETQIEHVTNSFVQYRNTSSHTIEEQKKKIKELTGSVKILKETILNYGNMKEELLITISDLKDKIEKGQNIPKTPTSEDVKQKEKEIEELKLQIRNHAKQLCNTDKYLKLMQRNVAEMLDQKDREIKHLKYRLQQAEYSMPKLAHRGLSRNPTRRFSMPVGKTKVPSVNSSTLEQLSTDTEPSDEIIL